MFIDEGVIFGDQPVTEHALPIYRCAQVQNYTPLEESHMKIRVSLSSYKLVYESHCEDVVWRQRGTKDAEVLGKQVEMREGERRRCLFLER